MQEAVARGGGPLRAVGAAGLVYLILRPVSADRILLPVLITMWLVAVAASSGRRRLNDKWIAIWLPQIIFD